VKQRYLQMGQVRGGGGRMGWVSKGQNVFTRKPHEPGKKCRHVSNKKKEKK